MQLARALFLPSSLLKRSRRQGLGFRYKVRILFAFEVVVMVRVGSRVTEMVGWRDIAAKR